MSKNITQTTKKRNWACIVYPESAPEDWTEIIKLTGLQFAVSPLHDRDLEADGITKKKPHWHIILVYGSPTTYNNVKNLTDRLNAPGPIPLDQIRGYYRYFTHKDNPEKFQYDEKNIKVYNGFSIVDFIELTRSEVTKIVKELQTLIRSKNILEYSDLMDYLNDFGMDSEYDVANSHTYFFHTYISSRRNKQKNNIVSSSTVSNSSASSLAQQASE